MTDIASQGREPAGQSAGRSAGQSAGQSAGRNDPIFVGAGRGNQPQQLADVLERVLDKGVVIVGDIQVRLLDIELLTIKIRLMVASVDRAREMGINWWEGDPFVANIGDADKSSALEQRINALERQLGQGGGSQTSQTDDAQAGDDRSRQEQEAGRGQSREQP